MAKSISRDFFCYPMGEEDLVQFVVTDQQPIDDSKPIITEDELRQVLETIQFSKIYENIKYSNEITFDQRNLIEFSNSRKDIEKIMYRTYSTTLSQAFHLILKLIQLKTQTKEQKE